MRDADRASGVGFPNGGLSPSPEDFEAVFEAMQARLGQLVELPLIRNDPIARGLLEDMARDAGPDGLNVLLDRLDARVKFLLDRKGGVAGAASSRRERPLRTLLRL